MNMKQNSMRVAKEVNRLNTRIPDSGLSLSGRHFQQNKIKTNMFRD